jgi:hypothetical protein
MKQVAYNQRILEAEREISGINCDVSDFLSGMTVDPDEQLVICVNGSQEMKRHEQAMAGQLWMQSDRKMTAANQAYDGMQNTREAAILSAVAEAVTWKNGAIEGDPPRKGQRVVIYPKELTQLGEVLSTGNPNVEEEKGHHIAYQKVLAASQSYERPPLFLSEDSDQITSDPVMAANVPNWMDMAERIATGSRRRVLENGPDTWGSDDEAQADIEADEEKGMYTPEMDPKKGPKVLPQREAARQRATGKALEAFKKAARPGTPVGGSSDDDDPASPATVWSQSRQCFRPNKNRPKQEETRVPTPLTTPVNSDDEGMSEDQRRMVNLGKRMSQKGTKKSTPKTGQVPVGKRLTEGQESPVAKATHPMSTRGKASGAGGLRGVVGSGQTDTCVASGHPSKT